MSAEYILLVEDNDDDVFFFELAAKKAGLTCPIVVVRDGLEAIEYLSNDARQKQNILVFLDLKLPFHSGLEILKWMHTRHPLEQVATFVLTSSEADRDIDAAFAAGANSYIVKPGEPKKLAKLLSRAWTSWVTQDWKLHAKDGHHIVERSDQSS